MKHRRWIAITVALLTACMLVSCGQHAEESTHSSLSADTTSAPREIETPICTEVYIEPSEGGETTETPATELYDGLFYYQYAADLGNYSCVYITPEQTAVWNTQSTPDFDHPEQSDGFLTAYTAPTDAEQYRQLLAVMTQYFEEIDKRGYTDEVTDLDAESSTMYDLLEALWLYRDGEAYAHRQLHRTGALYVIRQLHQIVDDAVIRATAPTPAADEPEVVAVLWLGTGAYALYNTARYYADGTMTQWGYLGGTPDLRDPLSTPEKIDEKEYSIGALPEFPRLNGLLMRYEQEGVALPTDLGYALTLFYLADGSVRVTRSYNWNGIYTTWNETQTALHALWH